jgi:hypothetical protein
MKESKTNITEINLTDPGRKPKPGAWKSGTDPIRHLMYHNWHRARAQANFRREGWEFPFEDWVEAWQGRFDERGRTRDSICLTRRNIDQPWSLENTQLLTRGEHAERQFAMRRAGISSRKPRP